MDDGSLQGPIDEHTAEVEEELAHKISPESRFQNDEVHLAPRSVLPLSSFLVDSH